MSGVDTSFFILFVLLFGALATTNFIQAQTNEQTKYQNYFGIIYLIATFALVIIGWKSFYP